MAKIVSVDLEIASYSLRAQLEGILASHPEFRLKDWKDSNPPDLLILELLEGEKEKTFAYIKDLRTASPDTEIFLTASQADVNVLMEAIHYGISEFLPQPIKPEQIQKALAQYKVRNRRRQQATTSQQGKIICVVGGKAGVGTTTLTVNMALLLQESLKNSSNLLIDLNFQNGEIPLFLDMNPEHGLLALAHKSNFDAVFLQSLISVHPSGLSLLPLGKVVQEEEPVPSEMMVEALDLLASMFNFLVMDCGHGFRPLNRSMLERANQIFVVSTMEASALRATRKLLERIRELDMVGCEVVIVLNRLTSRSAPSIKQAEEFLKIKQARTISNDYDLACRAINEGKPLVELAPRSKLTKHIRGLITPHLASQKPTGVSVFSKLFNLLGKGKSEKKP